MEASILDDVDFNFKPERLSLVTGIVIDELYGLINEKDLKVIAEDPDFDDTALLDAVKIGQVIRNLLGNAIKFSKQNGEIELAIRKEDSRLLFSLVDNGIGIPEEELESIFDQFVQSSRNKNGAGGTGLGLAISKKIIKSHHHGKSGQRKIQKVARSLNSKSQYNQQKLSN